MNKNDRILYRRKERRKKTLHTRRKKEGEKTTMKQK
jgi:hypothetical protein